jgi:hypothetical protein
MGATLMAIAAAMSFLSVEVRIGIAVFFSFRPYGLRRLAPPQIHLRSHLVCYFSSVPVIDRITPFTASTQGGTTITVIGSQFGPSPTARTSAEYSDQALILFGNRPTDTPAPVYACNPPTVDGSSGQLTCSFPAYSGGATSFALRYYVCIKLAFVVDKICVISAANALGQFGFSYNAPVISQISVPGTTSPTAGGMCRVLPPCICNRNASLRSLCLTSLCRLLYFLCALSGARVTLTGSDFTASRSATASVIVNGATATITSMAPSQIIFTSPAVRILQLTRCFLGNAAHLHVH